MRNVSEEAVEPGWQSRTLSRRSGAWGGVRAEVVRRDAIPPYVFKARMPHHAVFFNVGQRPVRVTRFLDGHGPSTVKAGTWDGQFLSAGTELRTEHPDGCPKSHYLSLFIDPGQTSRLTGDGAGLDVGLLRSGPLGDDAVLKHLLVSVVEEVEQPACISPLFADAATLLILGRLVRNVLGGSRSDADPVGGLAPYQLNRVTKHIRERIADDLSLTELASLVGLSPQHFCRAFHRSTGVPPHRWQILRRIEVAQGMMLSTRLALAEIAIATGFSDQAHFTTAFRRLTGTTPHAWRRSAMT